jgi:hypothetical protein
VAVVVERLQRSGEFKQRPLQVVAILRQQQPAGVRALRHRQVGTRPLLGGQQLLQACEDAEQRIRRQREIVDADVAVVSGGNDRGGNDAGANRLQHQPHAFFQQTDPAHRIRGIHHGFGVEHVRIEPGEVARIIGGGVRRPGDEKSFRLRKRRFHRVPVQLVDCCREMVLSQEPVAEKIDGLNTVGDKGCEQTLIKSDFAMRAKCNLAIGLTGHWAWMSDVRWCRVVPQLVLQTPLIRLCTRAR